MLLLSCSMVKNLSTFQQLLQQMQNSYGDTLQLGISDHDIVVKIRKCKLPKPPPKLISYRSMKRFDTDIFLQDLNSVPWDCAFIHDDINDIWATWYKLFTLRGNAASWMTPKIIQAINTRNRLHRRFTKKKTSENWETYRKQRNLVTSLKRSFPQVILH